MDAMDMSDLLTLVLMLLGVLALLGVAVIGFVMWRYRIPPRGLIAMIGALVYLASPVDVLPEVMLGPPRPPRRCQRGHCRCGLRVQARDGQEATPGCGRQGPAQEARSAGVTAVCCIPLGVYRPTLARWFCRRMPRSWLRWKSRSPSAYARFRPLVALCARPVHRLAMTAMLKSQRGLSDLSLLARSQLGQPRFASGRSRHLPHPGR